MKNLSLYRKYRPSNFDNLVGQEHVRTTLVNALKAGSIAHAYLFSGPRGTGKTSTARLIAKSLNCSNKKEGFEPCDQCEFCNDINSGRLIDLVEIDAASNRGIDEIRALKEKIQFAPTRAEHKVYIIDEVHMLTKEAFNALLKTLEEPPSHAIFILATTEVHKIPDTIISRCQRFDFRRIANDHLVERLSTIAEAEKIDVEEGALEMISKYAAGGMRDAISLFEQLISDKKVTKDQVFSVLGVSDLGLINDLFISLLKNETTKALEVVNQLYKKGADMQQFAQEFIEFLREKMLNAVSKKDISGAEKVIKLIDLFKDAAQNPDAQIPQLPLEMAIVNVSLSFASNSVRQTANTSSKTSSKSSNKVTPPPVKQTSPKEEERKSEPVKVQKPAGSVAEAWSQIVAQIKPASLARSLKNAKLNMVSDDNLELIFGSNFHMDQALNAESQAQVEKLLQESTGKSIKIKGKVAEHIASSDEVNASNRAHKKISVTTPKAAPAPEQKPEKKESGNQLSTALDVFGGEVMD